MEKRIEVLEEENRRYEDDLEIKTIALEEEKEKRKAQDALRKELEKKIKNPEPPCDFGQKGEKWSYEVQCMHKFVTQASHNSLSFDGAGF